MSWVLRDALHCYSGHEIHDGGEKQVYWWTCSRGFKAWKREKKLWWIEWDSEIQWMDEGREAR